MGGTCVVVAAALKQGRDYERLVPLVHSDLHLSPTQSWSAGSNGTSTYSPKPNAPSCPRFATLGGQVYQNASLSLPASNSSLPSLSS